MRQRALRSIRVAIAGSLGLVLALSLGAGCAPDGGGPDKPVGLVHLCAAGPDGALAQRLDLPGDRAIIRSRATVAALHLVRRLLTQSRHEPV